MIEKSLKWLMIVKFFVVESFFNLSRVFPYRWRHCTSDHSSRLSCKQQWRWKNLRITFPVQSFTFSGPQSNTNESVSPWVGHFYSQQLSSESFSADRIKRVDLNPVKVKRNLSEIRKGEGRSLKLVKTKKNLSIKCFYHKEIFHWIEEKDSLKVWTKIWAKT